MSLYLIPLIAPIALLFAGLFALTSPGLRPAILPRLAQIAALIALAAACSGAVLVVLQGPDTGSLLGVGIHSNDAETFGPAFCPLQIVKE